MPVAVSRKEKRVREVVHYLHGKNTGVTRTMTKAMSMFSRSTSRPVWVTLQSQQFFLLISSMNCLETYDILVIWVKVTELTSIWLESKLLKNFSDLQGSFQACPNYLYYKQGVTKGLPEECTFCSSRTFLFLPTHLCWQVDFLLNLE